MVERVDDATWERRCLEAVRKSLYELERNDAERGNGKRGRGKRPKGKGTKIHFVELEGTRPDATIVVSWTPHAWAPERTMRYPVYGGYGSGSPEIIADAIWLEVMES